MHWSHEVKHAISPTDFVSGIAILKWSIASNEMWYRIDWDRPKYEDHSKRNNQEKDVLTDLEHVPLRILRLE